MLDVSGAVNTNSVYQIDGHKVLSTQGDEIISVGSAAGANNTGRYSVFVGDSAGYNNQSDYNVFLGRRSGYSNTTGFVNTFVGERSGFQNTEGAGNTFLGHLAGWQNTTGNNNTYLGEAAGLESDMGHRNTFLGAGAGGLTDTGSKNVFIGFQAGATTHSGSSNVFIGHFSGRNEQGSNKLIIATDSVTSSVLIYGDFSTGRVGIGTTSPSYKLDVDGDINTTGEVRKNGFAYNFPDYVFEPGYELMPLAELSDFVAAEKHLPGMPSAEEVKRDGVKLFEQNRLLVEKLEEAYLYIIELQERVAKLEN
jgi:hypothetical protein